MKKIKNVVIGLLTATMLFAQYVPVMAEAKGVERYSFDLVTIKPTAAKDSAPVVYNTTYADEDYKNYYGRERIGGEWCAWVDINYGIIGDKANFTSYCMQFVNEDKVPGLSMDFSGIRDTAYAAFSVSMDDGVDRNNLYFVLAGKTDDGIAYAGVPVSEWINSDEKDKMISIPLAEFENNVIGATGTNNSFDLSSFCGMGVARIKDSTANSDGKIRFSKLTIAGLDAINDLTAEAEKGAVAVSFSKPVIDTVDNYIFTIENAEGKKKTLTLTAADFEEKDGRYIWRHSDAEEEVEYTYTVIMHESVYGIKSPISNAAKAFLPEDIGGEDIPMDGTDSIVEWCEARNFTWPIPAPKHWCTEARGADRERAYNSFISAPSVGMGTGTVIGYNLSYDVKNKTEEEAAAKFEHLLDYYYCGLYATDAVYGGAAGKDKESVNISAAKDSGYLVYKMLIENSVDLENAYFVMGSNWYKDKDTSIIMAVPIKDYVSDADIGKYITVKIPLTDFSLSNPHIFQRIFTFSWSPIYNEKREFDFTHLNFLGLLRDCNENVIKNPTSGYIYISDMMICNVEPVTEMRVEDAVPGRVILAWNHSETKAEKYNIYRIANDVRTFVGTSVTNRFSDTNNGNGFETEKNFTYEAEAEDRFGVKSIPARVTFRIEKVDKPRNFSAKPYYSDGSIPAVDISWQPAEYGTVSEYVLYRNGTEYKRFDNTVEEFRDIDVQEHGKYTYYMKSAGMNGEISAPTEKITVSAVCLPQISDLKCVPQDENGINISWNAAEYAKSYELKFNGKSVMVENTSYLAENLPYYTELIFEVRAVNASGAKSDVVSSSPMLIEKSDEKCVLDIFDESSQFNISSSDAAAKISGDKAISGNLSLQVSFPNVNFNTQSVKFDGKWDIENYRENSGILTFWIWADDNIDFSKMDAAFGTTTTLLWSQVPLRTKVKLDNYVSQKGKWKYVEIPLSDFSDYGVAEANGEEISTSVNFSNLKELAFLYKNSESPQKTFFYLDRIQIKQGKNWSIVNVTDENGTKIDKTVSAAAKAFRLEFDTDMMSNSIDARLEDSEGKVLNSFGEYNNRVYTLNLLEPLDKNAAYTLHISGKTAPGTGGSDKISFSADNTEPGEITYTIPDIKPQIKTSVSGSMLVAAISLPETYSLKKYEMNINYDESEIRLNGDDAIELIGMKGASVVKKDGKIIITGNMNGEKIAGDAVKIAFAVQKAANTQITASGTAEVFNTHSDKISPAKISAKVNVPVTKNTGGSGSSSGSGGSGGSAGSSAGRGSSTTAGDTPINPTVEHNVSFTDLNEVAWAAESITELSKKGYISGYPDNTFKPLNEITREEFAALIIRIFKFATEDESCPFEDVLSDAWYRQAVTIAYQKGIISGLSEDTFGVGKAITREDMCTMLYRALAAARVSLGQKFDKYSFADNDDISVYAAEAVEILQRAGIINGVSDTEFAPKLKVNRAMAAKVLYAAEQLM